MKSVSLNRGELLEILAKLRERGATESQLAECFVYGDDIEVTHGHSLDELVDLQAKVPEMGRFDLKMLWVVVHSKVEIS